MNTATGPIFFNETIFFDETIPSRSYIGQLLVLSDEDDANRYVCLLKQCIQFTNEATFSDDLDL